MTEPAGALLFARYAYPPNALGLCGADSPVTLLEYGDAGESDGGLAELARTFEGAWPYLTLIAESSRIEDPLDPRVVEAYWVGNDLLSHVPPAVLARHVSERFRGRLGSAGDAIPSIVAAGGVPHHCFHVFALYPWLGLLRSGIVDEPLRVLDQCRTTPALVVSVEGESAEVLARAAALGRREAAASASRSRAGCAGATAAVHSPGRSPGSWSRSIGTSCVTSSPPGRRRVSAR